MKISDLAFGEFLQILEWVAEKKGKAIVLRLCIKSKTYVLGSLCGRRSPTQTSLTLDKTLDKTLDNSLAVRKSYKIFGSPKCFHLRSADENLCQKQFDFAIG